MVVEELDVVVLPDGRSGTVLDFYENGAVAMIEVCDEYGQTLDMPFVQVSEIKEIIYKYMK